MTLPHKKGGEGGSVVSATLGALNWARTVRDFFLPFFLNGTLIKAQGIILAATKISKKHEFSDNPSDSLGST